MDDARFVQLALEHGFVTAAQVDKARQEQKTLADRGIEASQWFLLQDLGFVTEEQAKRLRKGMSSNTLRALEVDGYIIQGRLGTGGMGDVFRAENAEGHQVAVKLLNAKFSTNPEYVRRFEREARAAERLQHPHICHGLRHGEVGGHHFLLMELVDGPSLKIRLQDHGPLDEGSSLALLEQMAEALGHAWSKGVLHRDVKPANIILGPPRPEHAEPFCARLCDFGLAKLWQDGQHADEESHGGLTGAGLALGTPHYMAPEQASGAHDLDQRSDIYGLGATLYHALMGHTMYSGKSSAVIMYKQVTEQIDLQALRLKGTRERLVALLERMLAKDRAKRIATWDEVLREVRRIRTRHEAPVESSTARHARRMPWMVGGGVAAAVVVATVALLLPPIVPTASPTSLARVLAESSTAGTRHIRLVPGRYTGPVVLGAIHAGLTLTATGPGVELDGGTGVGLRVDTGARDVVLQGITLRGRPGLLVAGGSLTVTECTIQADLEGPALHQQGGVVTVTGGRVTGGVLTEGRTRAVIQKTALEGSVIAMNTDLVLREVTVQGPVSASLGGLELDHCIVRAPGAEAAVRLDRGATLEARSVELEGAKVGLMGYLALAPHLEDLRIRASAVGMRWTGPADPAWSWTGLQVQAPEPGIPTPSR